MGAFFIVHERERESEMKVDYRSIKKRTGCTEKQARYIAEEIRKYPKVKDIILTNIDKVNLRNCDEVKVVPFYGHYDTAVNVVGYLVTDVWSFAGTEFRDHKLLKYSFDELFPSEMFFEMI